MFSSTRCFRFRPPPNSLNDPRLRSPSRLIGIKPSSRNVSVVSPCLRQHIEFTNRLDDRRTGNVARRQKNPDRLTRAPLSHFLSSSDFSRFKKCRSLTVNSGSTSRIGVIGATPGVVLTVNFHHFRIRIRKMHSRSNDQHQE